MHGQISFKTKCEVLCLSTPERVSFMKNYKIVAVICNNLQNELFEFDVSERLL